MKTFLTFFALILTGASLNAANLIGNGKLTTALDANGQAILNSSTVTIGTGSNAVSISASGSGQGINISGTSTTFDAGHGQTDGAGGINNYNGYARYKINGADGSMFFDSGNIYSDGSGNLTVAGRSTSKSIFTVTGSSPAISRTGTSGIYIANQLGTTPSIWIDNEAAGTDARLSNIYSSDSQGDIYATAINDANTAALPWFQLSRSGATPSGITFYPSSTFNNNVTQNGSNNTMPNQAYANDASVMNGGMVDARTGWGTGQIVVSNTDHGCVWTLQSYTSTTVAFNATFVHYVVSGSLGVKSYSDAPTGNFLIGNGGEWTGGPTIIGDHAGNHEISTYFWNLYNPPTVLSPSNSAQNTGYGIYTSGTFTGTVGSIVSGTGSGASATVMHIVSAPTGTTGSLVYLAHCQGLFSIADTNLVVDGSTTSLNTVSPTFGGTTGFPGGGVFLIHTQGWDGGNGTLEVINNFSATDSTQSVNVAGYGSFIAP